MPWVEDSPGTVRYERPKRKPGPVVHRPEPEESFGQRMARLKREKAEAARQVELEVAGS